MTDPFFRVATIGKGSLWIGPRPQSETVNKWAAQASALSITHVVSLIENAEIERYGLDGEGVALKAPGISFEHFPVDDFDVPDGGKFKILTSGLMDRLSMGENLLLHCAGGVGRAGTTACCLLVKTGVEPDQSMKLVSAARGKTVPETEGQINFIRKFAAQS